jgi:hypothetical protein
LRRHLLGHGLASDGGADLRLKIIHHIARRRALHKTGLRYPVSHLFDSQCIAKRHQS